MSASVIVNKVKPDTQLPCVCEGKDFDTDADRKTA